MNAKRFLCIVSSTLATTCLLVTVPAAYAQTDLPDSIKVPDGHKIALETVGTGEITYECRERLTPLARLNGLSSAPKRYLMIATVNRSALTSDRLLPGKLKTALKSPGHNWQLPSGTGDLLSVSQGQPS